MGRPGDASGADTGRLSVSVGDDDGPQEVVAIGRPATDKEFSDAYAAEKPRWAELADRLK